MGSQSVKSTEAGGDRGFDAGKNIRGRKHQVSVDTNGLVIRALVCAADISDNESGMWLLLNHSDAFPNIHTLRVDQGYKKQFAEWASQQLGCTVEVCTKPSGQQGCVVQTKRWVVERTLAWLGRNRQISKEYDHRPDHRPESTEAWIYLASIGLLLNRLLSSS